MSKKEKPEWLGKDALSKYADFPTLSETAFERFAPDVTPLHLLNTMKAAVEAKQLEDLPMLVNGKEIANFHISASTRTVMISTESKVQMEKPRALSMLTFLSRHHESIKNYAIRYEEDVIVDIFVEDGQVKFLTNKGVDDEPEESDGRPTWDEYGLRLAKEAATRADCTRRKVGATLMAADHSIISMGYNGGPSKGPSCLKGECPRGRLTHDQLPPDSAYDTGGGTCVALHAEWNLIIRTDYHKFAGSTLYITEEPCHICKVMIAGTGIIRVVAPDFEWLKADTETLDRIQCEWLIQGPGKNSRQCTKLKGHMDPHD